MQASASSCYAAIHYVSLKLPCEVCDIYKLPHPSQLAAFHGKLRSEVLYMHISCTLSRRSKAQIPRWTELVAAQAANYISTYAQALPASGLAASELLLQIRMTYWLNPAEQCEAAQPEVSCWDVQAPTCHTAPHHA